MSQSETGHGNGLVLKPPIWSNMVKGVDVPLLNTLSDLLLLDSSEKETLFSFSSRASSVCVLLCCYLSTVFPGNGLWNAMNPDLADHSQGWRRDFLLRVLRAATYGL